MLGWCSVEWMNCTCSLSTRGRVPMRVPTPAASRAAGVVPPRDGVESEELSLHETVRVRCSLAPSSASCALPLPTNGRSGALPASRLVLRHASVLPLPSGLAVRDE